MARTTVVELGPEDTDELLALYEEEEWWADRERATLRHALEHTPLALGLRTYRDDRHGENGRLVAAARVLTDFAYYATVYDVIVAEAHRGDGIGRRLMEAVVDHPSLADVNPMLLCRGGLVSFYETCGFEEYDVTTDIAGCEEGFVRMVHWREGARP